MEDKDGFMVQLDEQGHCLLHDKMEAIRPHPTQDAHPFYGPLLAEGLEETAEYQDPVDGKTYLVSTAL
jgi:hypothetical protein